jgi:hypothetical protein
VENTRSSDAFWLVDARGRLPSVEGIPIVGVEWDVSPAGDVGARIAVEMQDLGLRPTMQRGFGEGKE